MAALIRQLNQVWNRVRNKDNINILAPRKWLTGFTAFSELWAMAWNIHANNSAYFTTQTYNGLLI